MRYENFVLHIGSKRGEVYSVQVLESPAGEGSGKFEPPLTRAEIGSFFGQVRKPRPDRRGGDASLSLPPDGFLREPTPTGRQGLKTRDLRRRRGNLPQSQTAQTAQTPGTPREAKDSTAQTPGTPREAKDSAISKHLAPR